ncbi:ribosome hibernation-promoting factor, HPF/YfiA family [Acidocella sp. KAb 2-4]|uniref:ribosome hibernation-promoting factor, HPF/YfiA family n=1 Tax=Acidocella sp. KAb 2-4 TaxID=2885158 RepID=UPI001D061EC5|nr:ribosome-associated translation inhibitor RaiA [Acidocella sp. KAb 2-4]MCB5943214.1 ribosome-associated translation inhibitor RaiA [Acidocella sp. KAb 2-4]
MQLTVSGKQVELSDALRVHVNKALETITSKYFDDALEAQVTFSRARSFFTCDINMHAGRGITVRGEGEAADAHGAFDDAAEHIAKRLRRYRRRVSEHAREAGNRAKPQSGTQYVLKPEPEVEHDSADHPAPAAVNGEALHAAVVAESTTSIETLSVRDAVMKMDLAFQPVLMFRNAKNGQLNVVYRRPDGNVGWIDPGVSA